MYISQQIAANAVHLVMTGRNLTLALPESIKRFPAATPQQRAAAADLSYGTLRFYGEVNAYLCQLLKKPVSSPLINSLLQVAIYQLLYDKAESHTVVNQAVIAAGCSRLTWAKGLVNAVLRNFLRQKTALAIPLMQDEAARFSYQKWWIDHLKRDYPTRWQAMLAAGNMHPPLCLRINTTKISITDYVDLLTKSNLDGVHLGGQAVALAKPMAVEKIPLFSQGVVSVQDYGAQLAAILLEAKAGMRVLDACAAPGGKTGHILEQAKVNLTAIDSDAKRLARVSSNLERLQLKARLLTGNAADPKPWWDGVLFDRILADVPCTASGIVRRHVDIKWLRREADIVSFTQQQAAILHSLWQLLSKGGKLLYVTCSIFKEENQHQIDAFLEKNIDATQLPISLTDDANQSIDADQGQCIPNAVHDGFFYALLQKR